MFSVARFLCTAWLVLGKTAVVDVSAFQAPQGVPVPTAVRSSVSFPHVPTPKSRSLLKKKYTPKLVLFESPQSEDGILEVGHDDDKLFDIQTTLALVGGQSVLVGVAVLAAYIVGTPNYGLGPDISFSPAALANGALLSLPLGVLAVFLDVIENRVPALQDVTKATQRSVLALLGGKWKPTVAVITALALGLAAGIGEEMLFRGVLQYELEARFGGFAAVTIASIIFGALHAVTPLYAFLASIASVYFGWLYTSSGNLTVPITTHALYDFLALMYCHYEVSKMSPTEQQAIAEWKAPMDP